jgi:hypothetical protein
MEIYFPKDNTLENFSPRTRHPSVGHRSYGHGLTNERSRKAKKKRKEKGNSAVVMGPTYHTTSHPSEAPRVPGIPGPARRPDGRNSTTPSLELEPRPPTGPTTPAPPRAPKGAEFPESSLARRSRFSRRWETRDRRRGLAGDGRGGGAEVSLLRRQRHRSPRRPQPTRLSCKSHLSSLSAMGGFSVLVRCFGGELPESSRVACG